MGKHESIPTPAVRRLSLYLRQLEAFRDSNLRTVSSKQLGQALRITDAQVRKDLAYFGQFGQPGIGYDVEELITKVRQILGTDRTWPVLLVGTGNLGRALVSYKGFQSKGFEVVAIFDDNPALHGKAFGENGPKVLPMEMLDAVVKDTQIRLAILSVPAMVAQSVTDKMIAAGVKGILNFAPVALQVPRGVNVSNVDLAVHLEQLSFGIGSSAV